MVIVKLNIAAILVELNEPLISLFLFSLYADNCLSGSVMKILKIMHLTSFQGHMMALWMISTILDCCQLRRSIDSFCVC
jgi:hypothetical protein